MDQMSMSPEAGRWRQKNECVSRLVAPAALSAGLIPALTKQIASNFNYLCSQPRSPSTTPPTLLVQMKAGEGRQEERHNYLFYLSLAECLLPNDSNSKWLTRFFFLIEPNPRDSKLLSYLGALMVFHTLHFQ